VILNRRRDPPRECCHEANNNGYRMGRTSLNRSNGFYDRNMNRVETTQVRQIADRAFFHRGGRWLDSRVVEREKTLTPDETVRSGTPEYASLVYQLPHQRRPPGHACPARRSRATHGRQNHPQEAPDGENALSRDGEASFWNVPITFCSAAGCAPYDARPSSSDQARIAECFSESGHFSVDLAASGRHNLYNLDANTGKHDRRSGES